MYDDDDDENECLPIPRRSLVNRITNHFGSDSESPPPLSDRRQSRLILDASISTDSGVDEHIQTPGQLIALYEKTIELAAQNKINAKNAFHFPFVERLPEILDIIAFDEKLDSFHSHHAPNFVKAGSVIDTSAKIYGYRVDALHTETQKLNGTIQQNDEEESNLINSDQIQEVKKSTPRTKSKVSTYLATDLSTISLAYEFKFHPFQPSHMCQWPGGVGSDSLYADMVSYTMYSSSDYPLLNGFINLNSQINKEYDDNERILDIAMKTMYDLIPLREVIREHEEQDHILGCQTLRQFSFNEDSTVSYIETIDECSMMDISLVSSNDDDDDQEMRNELVSNGLSEFRDDPSNFYSHELQSAHTFPTTMVSMDVTLLHSKMSFVDHIPLLLRDKTDSSEYGYFDSSKLKLFAGPYLWKYTNLLPEEIKSTSKPEQQSISIRPKRQFKLNLSNEEINQSLNELMSINSWTRKAGKKRKTKLLPVTTLRKIEKFPSHERNSYQLRLCRRLRPLIDLSCLNYFPDHNLEVLLNSYEDYSRDVEETDPFPDQLQYDFDRPIHYDKIEFDKNFAKIDAKKLQIQLYDEYNREHTVTSNPIALSTLCAKLIEQGMISYEKDQIASAFYCMLNNCNKNQLYMKNNLQRDDLIIQKQPIVNSTQLTYSHAII